MSKRTNRSHKKSRIKDHKRKNREARELNQAKINHDKLIKKSQS